MTKILRLLRIHSLCYNTTTIFAFSCAEEQGRSEAQKREKAESVF